MLNKRCLTIDFDRFSANGRTYRENNCLIRSACLIRKYWQDWHIVVLLKIESKLPSSVCYMVLHTNNQPLLPTCNGLRVQKWLNCILIENENKNVFFLTATATSATIEKLLSLRSKWFYLNASTSNKFYGIDRMLEVWLNVCHICKFRLWHWLDFN